MNKAEQEVFKKEFKSIVYVFSEIKNSNLKLKQLHFWDKNGSHEKAILKEIERRNQIKEKLNILLKGRTYEDWLETSKNLTKLNSRLKALILKKEKIESDINALQL